MTRRVLSISLLVALSWGTAGIAQEQESANFSGTWLADRQRSESFKQVAAAAAQSPVRLIIKQSATDLSVERQRDDGGSDTISYSFDNAVSTARAAANESPAPAVAQPEGTAGKVADAAGPAVSASGTSVTNARAEWKDGRLMLLTVWSVNGRTVDTREALILSPDGRELTVQTELKMQHGYESDHPDAKSASDAKDVFVKSSGK